MATAGEATKLGPFTGGLHNSSGSEFIDIAELYELVNAEVDTDGSIVNRPQISEFAVTGFVSDGMTFIGTYLPADGRRFVVAYAPSAGKVYLIDAFTGVMNIATALAVTSVCCIQYSNKLWVIPAPGSPNPGGFFDVPTSSTTSWTADADIPQGEAVAQYRERIWIASGINSTVNTSRFYYSSVGDPGAWAGIDFIDVAPGNGQKLVSLIRLGNDLVLFKEHSTHKFTYTVDPRKAELNELDSDIGAPAINCAVQYQNNTIYVLHDNAVYELFQYTYTRISQVVDMNQETDLDLYAKDQYGLTRHRDRLFVRYYKNFYVYSMKVKRWSSWETVNKFSKVVVIPSATVGLDRAYAHSASILKPTAAYFFQDVRQVDATSPSSTEPEGFKVRVRTKTYDFDVPQSYKKIFWWGIAVATSGNLTAQVLIPNASENLSWTEANTLYGSWAGANAAGINWANNVTVTIDSLMTPTLGGYARKFLKLFRKIRFRQVYFVITFDVLSNGGISDTSLRLFDLTVILKQAQTVVKGTS